MVEIADCVSWKWEFLNQDRSRVKETELCSVELERGRVWEPFEGAQIDDYSPRTRFFNSASAREDPPETGLSSEPMTAP